jgi:hypothetical protein
MDEEFVKKVLGQAMQGGEPAPDNANALWECYKRFLKEHQPDVYSLVEQNEIVMKKHFFFGIDIFTSVGKYLYNTGTPRAIAAGAMYRLEQDVKIEIQRMVDEEKKKI